LEKRKKQASSGLDRGEMEHTKDETAHCVPHKKKASGRARKRIVI